MRGRLVRTFAWKGLLYLVVAVVLAGVTRDRMLSVLLTVGFAAGDSSVAVLLRAPIRRSDPSDHDERADGTDDARPSPSVGSTPP